MGGDPTGGDQGWPGTDRRSPWAFPGPSDADLQLIEALVERPTSVGKGAPPLIGLTGDGARVLRLIGRHPRFGSIARSPATHPGNVLFDEGPGLIVLDDLTLARNAFAWPRLHVVTDRLRRAQLAVAFTARGPADLAAAADRDLAAHSPVLLRMRDASRQGLLEWHHVGPVDSSHINSTHPRTDPTLARWIAVACHGQDRHATRLLHRWLRSGHLEATDDAFTLGAAPDPTVGIIRDCLDHALTNMANPPGRDEAMAALEIASLLSPLIPLGCLAEVTHRRTKADPERLVQVLMALTNPGPGRKQLLRVAGDLVSCQVEAL